jgi:hypothetical protein
VLGQLLPQEGEVVLLERRGGQGGFGVEQAGELVDDCLSLEEETRKALAYV